MTTLRLRAADGFVHQALFYRGAAEYLDHIVPFIREGLAGAQPVLVAVPGPNLRLILAEMGTDTKQVRWHDMTKAGRNPGRIIPSVLLSFAESHPTGRVRVIGEPIWAGRTPVEYPACVQHEALINLAFADRPVTILCPYDVERLGRQVLADAEATHPLLIDGCGERDSPGYAPGRIITEYNLPLPPVAAPRFAFDATTLSHARRFARDQATRLGLDGDHTELELLVGELTANSVAHGGGCGFLFLWAEEGHLVCEVRDGGHITDPLAGRRLAGRQQLHGRGLLLVNLLADLVRIHTTPEGTTIRVYLGLPAPTAPGPISSPPGLTNGMAVGAVPAGGTSGGTAAGAGLPSGGGLPSGAGLPAGVGLPAGNSTAPDRMPLRWQTDDALRAAARFARYLPPEESTGFERLERYELRAVLEALAAAEVLVQVVELWRTKLVKLARLRGARWADIGRALGVSKQAAHERYAKTRTRTVNRKATAADGQGTTRSTR